MLTLRRAELIVDPARHSCTGRLDDCDSRQGVTQPVSSLTAADAERATRRNAGWTAVTGGGDLDAVLDDPLQLPVTLSGLGSRQRQVRVMLCADRDAQRDR